MDTKDLWLFDLLRIDEAQGTIFLHGQRMIVVNAGDLGLLRKELITTFGTDRARGILVRFGYARGYRDALATKQMFGWKSVDDWLNASARLYTIEGSGASEIVRLRVEQNKLLEASSILQNYLRPINICISSVLEHPRESLSSDVLHAVWPKHQGFEPGVAQAFTRLRLARQYKRIGACH